MNYFTARIKKGFLLVVCLAFALAAKAQNPTYLLYITNESVSSDAKTYQFDIFLLRTGTTPFELATVQFGLGFDTSIVNGGTLSASIVPLSSEMNASQVPVSVTIGASFQTFISGGIVYRYYNCAATSPPAAGQGTIISNVNTSCSHPGTRLATFKLINSVPFKPGSHCNHIFSTAGGSGRLQTKVNARVGTGPTSNVDITVDANHLGYNSIPPPPTCDQNINMNDCTFPVITSATSNSPICPESALSLNATATGTPAPDFSWSGTGTFSSTTVSNPTVTGAATGTYTVTVSNSCGSTSSNISVTLNTSPTVGASASPATICTGSSSTLTGTGASTYSWIPGSLTGSTVSVSPTVTTTYTVTGTAANSCTATATVMVTVENPVIVDAGVDQEACLGETITLSGTITNATSGTWSGGTGSYPMGIAWDPGVTQYETVAADAPSVSLTLTASNTCGSANDNIIVTINPLPTITATTSISVCRGVTSFNIPYSATTGSPDHYVLNPGSNPYWNFAQVDGTLPPAPSFISVSIDGSADPDVYFFELTVDNTTTGCQSGITTIALTVLESPPVAASASPATLCSGGSTTLTASGASTYSWQPGSLTGTTVSTGTLTSTTTYTVTGTAVNGCTATSEVTVNVDANPIILTAMKTDASFGGPTGTAGVTFEPTSGCTILWAPDGESSSYIEHKPAGTYTATVTLGGCTATRTLIIN